MVAPDVNLSAQECTVDADGRIRLGLNYVLGARSAEVAALVAARDAARPVPVAVGPGLARGGGPGDPRPPRLGGRLRRARGRRRRGGAAAAEGGPGAPPAAPQARASSARAGPPCGGWGWPRPARRSRTARSSRCRSSCPGAPALDPLAAWDAMVADYATTGLTLGPHPVELLRPELPAGAVSTRRPGDAGARHAGDDRRARRRPPAAGHRQGHRVPAARGRVRDDQPDRPAGRLRAPPAGRAHRAAAARPRQAGEAADRGRRAQRLRPLAAAAQRRPRRWGPTSSRCAERARRPRRRPSGERGAGRGRRWRTSAASPRRCRASRPGGGDDRAAPVARGLPRHRAAQMGKVRPHGRPRLRPPLRAARRSVRSSSRSAAAARARARRTRRRAGAAAAARRCCSCSRSSCSASRCRRRDRHREGPQLDAARRASSSSPARRRRAASCSASAAATATRSRRPTPRRRSARTLDTAAQRRRSCSTRSRRAARAATATCPPRCSRARRPRPSPSSSPSRAAASSSRRRTSRRAGRVRRGGGWSRRRGPFTPHPPRFSSRARVFGSAGASATMSCGSVHGPVRLRGRWL